MICTTIRGIYLDQIEAGTKLVEYRAYNEFWRKRIEGKRHGAIMFLSGRRCKAYLIVKIEVIETPEDLRDVIEEEKTFTIHLGGGISLAQARKTL